MLVDDSFFVELKIIHRINSDNVTSLFVPFRNQTKRDETKRNDISILYSTSTTKAQLPSTMKVTCKNSHHLLLIIATAATASTLVGAFTPLAAVKSHSSLHSSIHSFQTPSQITGTSIISLSSKCKQVKSAAKATNTNTALQMAVEGDFDPDAISKSVEEAKAGSLKAKLRALYKFTRPHTIRGTILASIAGTTRALIDTPGAIANADWGLMLPRAVVGMIALLLGNAFIVGINQIFDEEIDKLNKPFLPVASGEMSKRFAWGAVLTGGLVGPMLV